MGGVSASFAMLGDINVGEPKALIGFAGPVLSSRQYVKNYLKVSSAQNFAGKGRYRHDCRSS